MNSVEVVEAGRDSQDLPDKLRIKLPPEIVRGEVIPGRSPG